MHTDLPEHWRWRQRRQHDRGRQHWRWHRRQRRQSGPVEHAPQAGRTLSRPPRSPPIYPHPLSTPAPLVCSPAAAFVGGPRIRLLVRRVPQPQAAGRHPRALLVPAHAPDRPLLLLQEHCVHHGRLLVRLLQVGRRPFFGRMSQLLTMRGAAGSGLHTLCGRRPAHGLASPSTMTASSQCSTSSTRRCLRSRRASLRRTFRSTPSTKSRAYVCIAVKKPGSGACAPANPRPSCARSGPF